MTQSNTKKDEEVEGVSDFKSKLDDDDLLEIRAAMKQTLIADVENKLKIYLSDDDDVSDLGVQMAQTIESILLFGIIDPSNAWNICEHMIKKHSPLFDNPFQLIKKAGLPCTNVGRFRCFARLLLIESQFLQYWQCFPLHKKFVNDHFNEWSIIREDDSFKQMENLFTEYSERVFIQIPIDFENLDIYSYKLDRHGFVQPCAKREEATELDLDLSETAFHQKKKHKKRSKTVTIKEGKKGNPNVKNELEIANSSTQLTDDQHSGDEHNDHNNNNNTKTKRKDKYGNDDNSSDNQSKSKPRKSKIKNKSSKHSKKSSKKSSKKRKSEKKTKKKKTRNEETSEHVANYKDVNKTDEVDDDIEESFESTESSVVTKARTMSENYNGPEISPIPPNGDGNDNNEDNKTTENENENENENIDDLIAIKKISNASRDSDIGHNRKDSNISISSNHSQKSRKSRKSRKSDKNGDKSSKRKSKKRKSRPPIDKAAEPSIQSDVQESEKRENHKEDSLNLTNNTSGDDSITEKTEIKAEMNTHEQTRDKESRDSPLIPFASSPDTKTPLSQTMLDDNDEKKEAMREKEDRNGFGNNAPPKMSTTNDEFEDRFPGWQNVDTLHQLEEANRRTLITDDDKTPAIPDELLNKSFDYNSTTNYFGGPKSNAENGFSGNGSGNGNGNRRQHSGSSSGSGGSAEELDIDALLDFNKRSYSDSVGNDNDDTMSEMYSGSRQGSISIFSDIRSTFATNAPFETSTNSDDDNGDGKSGNDKLDTFDWESERKLIRNCWYDGLVHDEMKDVRILRNRKQILSKNSREKFNLSKETHLHSYFGVLWKKGESHNKWKQRYFELDWSKNDFKMKYYADKSKKSQKGYINLKNSYLLSTRLEKKGNKKWTQITIWEASRQWQLATDNETYAGYWIGVIDNAMNKITQIVRNQLYAKKYIYITDKTIILQGWLRKSNPKGKGFKERWWYLNTNLEKSPKLRYYEKDMSSKIGSNKVIKGYKGEIDVKKALHVGPCLEKNLYDEFPLCIDIVTKERTYHLVPNRLEQMELWIQTLRLFVPANEKKDFGNIFWGQLNRKLVPNKTQLTGHNHQNWQQSYCVLTARSLYYFKNEESYQLYRREFLISPNKVKFSNNEGIFEFNQGITFYELKGMYDNDFANCFALVLQLEKNKRKVDIFQARSTRDFAQWEQNFKAMGIEHKAVPAVGFNKLFA